MMSKILYFIEFALADRVLLQNLDDRLQRRDVPFKLFLTIFKLLSFSPGVGGLAAVLQTLAGVPLHPPVTLLGLLSC